MTSAKEKYPLDTPETKEAYLIREIFEGKIITLSFTRQCPTDERLYRMVSL